MKNSKEMPYEKVKELSTSFREAIENVDIGKLTVCDLTVCDFFRDFPRGRCGDASELLAKYLLENGIKAIYVSGVNGERTHAWLEYCDYIIDITADQFKENDTKVLVTKDKRFNDEFKEQNRYYPDKEKRKDHHDLFGFNRCDRVPVELFPRLNPHIAKQ